MAWSCDASRTAAMRKGHSDGLANVAQARHGREGGSKMPPPERVKTPIPKQNKSGPCMATPRGRKPWLTTACEVGRMPADCQPKRGISNLHM